MVVGELGRELWDGGDAEPVDDGCRYALDDTDGAPVADDELGAGLSSRGSEAEYSAKMNELVMGSKKGTTHF